MRSIEKETKRTQWLATIDAMPGRPAKATVLPMCPVTPKTEKVNPYIRVIYRAVSLLREAQRHAQVGFCDDPRALDLFIAAIRAFHELTFEFSITALTDGIEKCHDDGKSLMVLIGNNSKDINAMDSLGRTPLVLAVECGAKAGLVTCLLNAGASPNQADARGCTPLALAARSGNMALITLLIRHGASSRVPGWAPPGTLSPLVQAARNNHVTVLPLLCTALAAGESASTTDLTPQEMDRPRGRLAAPSAQPLGQILPWLYQTGLSMVRSGMELVSPELRQHLLNTQAIEALLQAAEHGHWEAVQFLSEAKGIVFAETSFDEALEKFCMSPTTGAHELEIVKLLYGRTQPIYRHTSLRTAPPAIILAAFETGKTNAAEFLLKADSVDFPQSHGHRIMKAALESGGEGLFKFAWERARRSFGRAKESFKATLILAVERGHVKAARQLRLYWRYALENATDACEFTAAAVKCGDQVMFESIWRRISKYNIDMQPEDLQMLLEIAVATRHRFAAKVLLDAGAPLFHAKELIPLLSMALSPSDIAFLKLIRREVERLTVESKIKILQAAVHGGDEDKNALRLAIDMVFDALVDTWPELENTVVAWAMDQSKVVREIMRYLLRRPQCAPVFAYAADLETGWVNPLNAVTSYFDILDDDWIAKITAQALSRSKTCEGVWRLLCRGAAAHMNKSTAFAALRLVCGQGEEFKMVPVLLNSRAGLTLNAKECRELLELAMLRVANHARDRSAPRMKTGPLDELRRRAKKVKETLT